MSYLVYRLGRRGGQKRSNDRDLGYYAAGTSNGQRDLHKPMPVNRTLPKFHWITEEDDKGRKIRKRIGYSPYEQTIYVDEFVNEESLLMRPKFKKGTLIVDTEKHPLLEVYMDKLDSNEDNDDRDKKAKIKFHKVNKNKSAKQILEKKQKITKELALFWDMPVTKRRAIANAIGEPNIRPSSQGLDVWQHNLYAWAENNVDKFVEMYHNPDLDYVDYISRAEDMRILRYNVGEWLFHDMKILAVSKNRNRYEELVKHLINNPSLNLNLRNDVKKKEGRTDFEIDEATTIDFAKMTGEQMLDLAVEKRVVKYKTGHGYEIISTGKIIGDKSKESAITAIETEDIVFDILVAQLTK